MFDHAGGGDQPHSLLTKKHTKKGQELQCNMPATLCVRHPTPDAAVCASDQVLPAALQSPAQTPALLRSELPPLPRSNTFRTPRAWPWSGARSALKISNEAYINLSGWCWVHKLKELRVINRGHKYIRDTNRERSESPMASVIWHASKYKVHSLEQRYISNSWRWLVRCKWTSHFALSIKSRIQGPSAEHGWGRSSESWYFYLLKK